MRLSLILKKATILLIASMLVIEAFAENALIISGIQNPEIVSSPDEAESNVFIQRRRSDGTAQENLSNLGSGVTVLDMRLKSDLSAIYWAQVREGIFKADFDTLENKQQLVTVEDNRNIQGIAIDFDNGYIYQSRAGGSSDDPEAVVDIHAKVIKTDLDGNNEVVIYQSEGSAEVPFSIDIDHANSKLIWLTQVYVVDNPALIPPDCCHSEFQVWRSNMDGSGLETIHTFEEGQVTNGMDVDQVNGKIYIGVSDNNFDPNDDLAIVNFNIKRMDLDGSNIETIFNETRFNYSDLVLAPEDNMLFAVSDDTVTSMYLDGSNVQHLNLAPSSGFFTNGSIALQPVAASETLSAATLIEGAAAANAQDQDGDGKFDLNVAMQEFFAIELPVTTLRDDISTLSSFVTRKNENYILYNVFLDRVDGTKSQKKAGKKRVYASLQDRVVFRNVSPGTYRLRYAVQVRKRKGKRLIRTLRAQIKAARKAAKPLSKKEKLKFAKQLALAAYKGAKINVTAPEAVITVP